MEVPAQAHRKVRRQRLVPNNVCSITSATLPISSPASKSRLPCLSVHSRCGLNRPSQSTTRPSIANSKASKATG